MISFSRRIVMLFPAICVVGGCSQPVTIGQSVTDRLSRAIDFTLDVCGEGTQYNLFQSLQKNRTVILVFWTTWCSSCRKEIPVLNSIQQKYRDTAKILSICVGQPAREVEGYIKKQGINYTVLLDEDARTANAYGVRATPAIFFIAPDKSIIYQGSHLPSDIEHFIRRGSRFSNASYMKVERSAIIMGTNILAVVYGEDRTRIERAIDEIFQELIRIEKFMTIFDPASEVSMINQAAGSHPVEVSEELIRVLKQAVHISRQTDGLFDITFAGFGKLWNFKDGNHNLPDPELLQGLLKKVGFNKISIDDRTNSVFLTEKGMSIDLGGIGKGYALDSAMQKIARYNLRGVLIQAGGDIKVRGYAGDRLWNITIKNPVEPDKDICSFYVTDVSISTSGDYERYFEKEGKRYHHILDPRTGYPASECKSVTVFGLNATETDALSTALFIMGPVKAKRWLKQHTQWQAVIVDANDNVWMSDALLKSRELTIK